jgi:mono/diheme cytochrome c family protein
MKSICGMLVPILALLAGCDQSMTEQPRNRTYSPSSIWSDGTSARPIPANTVARGDLARAKIAANPPPVTMALLQRGQERFDIYCSPCHGLAGHGDGMIVQRGFPAPPDYDSPRLRAATAAHIFDVITDGYGVMYSYRARVEPQDRWAIIAYIRALQASASMPPGKILAPGEKVP